MKTKLVIMVVVKVCLFIATHASLAGGPQTAPENRKNNTIRARGVVESAKYIDVRSPLTAKILKIAPEGVVKKGDLLVELDASEIEEQVSAQKIAIQRVRSKMVQVEQEREASVLEVEANIQAGERRLILAGLARERYLGEGGEHEVELKVIEGQIEIAKKRLSVAEKQRARFTKQADVVMADAVDRAELVVVEAKVALRAAIAKERLLRKHVQAFRKAELELQLDQAKSELARAKLDKTRKLELTAAAVAAHQQALQVETSRLKRKEQELKSSRIHAPQDGTIIYANPQTSRTRSQPLVKSGAMVRQRQTLIRIPDMSKLQLKPLVSQSQIERVKVGQQVTIKLDAFPDRVLRGKVTEVSRLANPQKFFSQNVRKFAVTVSIANPPANVKLGLTGLVEINVSESDKPR